MKNHLHNGSWLLTIIYVVSLGLQLAASVPNRYVVYKSNCPRKEARAVLKEAANYQTDFSSNFAAAENPGNQKASIKACPQKVLLGEFTQVTSFKQFLFIPRISDFKVNNYLSIKPCREPDPPRFA